MKKYLCRKCGKDMEYMKKFSLLSPHIMYCDNDKCLLYGILTLVGFVPEPKNESNTNKSNS